MKNKGAQGMRCLVDRKDVQPDESRVERGASCCKVRLQRVQNELERVAEGVADEESVPPRARPAPQVVQLHRVSEAESPARLHIPGDSHDNLLRHLVCGREFWHGAFPACRLSCIVALLHESVVKSPKI